MARREASENNGGRRRVAVGVGAQHGVVDFRGSAQRRRRALSVVALAPRGARSRAARYGVSIQWRLAAH